jgi:hypothetical protein
MRSLFPFDAECCCCCSAKNNRLQGTLDRGLKRIENQLDIRTIMSNALEFKIFKNIFLKSRERLLLKLQRFNTIEECSNSSEERISDTELIENSGKAAVYSQDHLSKIYHFLLQNPKFKQEREKKLVLGLFKR